MPAVDFLTQASVIHYLIITTLYDKTTIFLLTHFYSPEIEEKMLSNGMSGVRQLQANLGFGLVLEGRDFRIQKCFPQFFSFLG